MAKLTKKQKALEGKVDSTKLYPLTDALDEVLPEGFVVPPVSEPQP